MYFFFFVHCFFCFFLFLSSIQLSPIPLLTLELEPGIFSHLNSTGFLSKYKKTVPNQQEDSLQWNQHALVARRRDGGRGEEEGVGAPVSSCMHEEQKTERKKRWPAQTLTTSKWNWKEFAKCFCFSQKVVVTGFVVIIFYLLSTDAKLISGGRGQDH